MYVTGVQTCALPILRHVSWVWSFHQPESTTSEARAILESSPNVIIFFVFYFEVHGHGKGKHFYINCRNNLKGAIKYVIRNYALRSWCGKALVEELMITSFTSYCHLVNSRSWNEMTKLLKQRSDRNNNCTSPGFFTGRCDPRMRRTKRDRKSTSVGGD